ncbi:MAG TPA: hypothetical protein VF459_11465 [Caulobacteraceae bacterium]
MFANIDFHSFSENVRRAITGEIEGMDANRLLNTSTDDLVTYFEGKFHMEAPRLLEDQVEASSEEARIDVSRRFDYGFPGEREGPVMVKGLAVTYHVPFEGDAELFKVQPNQSYMGTIFNAQIAGQELRLRFQDANLTDAQVKGQYEQQIKLYRDMLGFLRSNLDSLNAQLGGHARAVVEQRKQKLLGDRSLTADLGVPLRTRPDAAKTYAAPEVRRKIAPTLPTASSAPFKPEPALTDEQYEHILKVVHSTAQVMERSPKAFKTMDEETLRTQILVQLNGHFEGQATAETFNATGKTDILIRSGDRNIFIAECKIWSGAEALLKALDQLLGYTAWRDTKTAIILFNRNKDFSAVLDKIDPSMKQHANFRRALPKPGETTWRYVFGHRDDSGRELMLTVLAFDIPAAD